MTDFSDRYRTMGELRRRLRARLGFMTQGPASKNNDEVLTDILQEGHEFILGEVDPSTLRTVATIQLSPGSYLYDWHNDATDQDIDPSKVISICVEESETSREPLIQGITPRMREDRDLRDYPTRYDTLAGQMELWPVPAGEYDLIIEYTGGPGRFDRDSDRPSVPDRLVLQYALSVAKAHYRHSDASVAGQAFERMLSRFKIAQHENRRYIVGVTENLDPQVVRTADGYRLRR